MSIPVYSCAALRNAVAVAGGETIYFDCSNSIPNLEISLLTIAVIDILIAPLTFGMPADCRNNVTIP